MFRAYSKLVWSHKGNKVATNGKGAALLRPVTHGKTPGQFSNWSKTVNNHTKLGLSQCFIPADQMINVLMFWRIHRTIAQSAPG